MSRCDINSVVFHFDDFYYGRRGAMNLLNDYNFNSAIRRSKRYIIITFFTNYNKMKKKPITLSEQFQVFNRRIVQIGKFDIPSTHIQDRSLSWLSTGTPVKFNTDVLQCENILRVTCESHYFINL